MSLIKMMGTIRAIERKGLILGELMSLVKMWSNMIYEMQT